MWEEEYICSKKIPQLKFYRRYIEDLIVLWDGTPEAFEEFLQTLNINRYGLTFPGKWNNHKIDYLDLEIFKRDEGLHTRTFFKATDRNGYMPMSSCHHPQWKGNIPKGQLLRIRRNCNTIEDFSIQVDLLIEQFQEKSYNLDHLLKLKTAIAGMDRKSLLCKSKRKQNQTHMAFVTGFNSQYKDLEHIMKK